MRGRLFLHAFIRLFIFFAIIILFTTSVVYAASSDFISFQAKLVNIDGTNVNDGTYTFLFSIYDSNSGGTLLWQESQSINVVDGVVSVDLGSVTPFPTNLFENNDLYLQIDMDTDGDTSNGYEEDFGRMAITSVAYAFHAKSADALSLGGVSYTPDEFLKVKSDNTWNPDQNLNYFSFLANSLDPLLFIDASNSKVGIGTNNPNADLQIVGNTQSSIFLADSGSATTPAYSFATDTNTGIYSPSADSLGIVTNGTDRLYVNSAGLIGINTTSPSATLDLNGSLLVHSTSLLLDDLTIKNSTNYPVTMDYGDGSDGDVTITSADTVINNYTYLTSNASVGDTTVSVNDSSSFSAGDLVLVIQMQSATDPSNVGNYEFHRVVSVSSGQLTLDSGLTFDYTTGTFNSTSAEASQVIRVPEYNNLTVEDGASVVAPAWDGQVGGIVVFKVANNLTFIGTGQVNVHAKGYRGGSCNGCGNNAWGQQGEGITGLGENSLDANVNGGGGGYGPSGYNGEPGAGGGCYTAGEMGDSTHDSTGGEAVCVPEKLIMGGGAGAGGDDDLKTPLPQYVDGAGAAFISAQNISNLNIDASGEDGISTNNTAGGTTGGGAGGTVKVYFSTLTEGVIDVDGGSGGVDADDKGGNGGKGLYIKNLQMETDTLLFADVSEGQIGIRQPNPEYPLDVGGIVRAVGYLEYSDKNLKKNIKKINSVLDKIDDLEPVVYQFKSKDFGTHKRLGFLAQDLEKLFPEVVFRDKDGTYSVDYIGLIAPTIKSVQELKSRIDNIETRLAKVIQMEKDGVFKVHKLSATHVVSKTSRTESLEVDKNILLGSDVAGTVTVTKGSDSAIIKSPAIGKNTIVVITQQAEDFDDYVRYIITVKDKQAILKIESPANKDLYFNYILINKEPPNNNSSSNSCTSGNSSSQNSSANSGQE